MLDGESVDAARRRLTIADDHCVGAPAINDGGSWAIDTDQPDTFATEVYLFAIGSGSDHDAVTIGSGVDCGLN
jgi:hypothetical protein